MSDDSQTDAVKVHIDGRLYPVKFTGEHNTNERVVGPCVDGAPVNFRHVPLNGSDVPADFYTPALRLGRICSAMARAQGIKKLQEFAEFVQNVPEDENERLELAHGFPAYDEGLTFNLTCYMREWNKVSGNADSAHIFRQDLKDIVRTIEEVYLHKGIDQLYGAAR